MLEPLDLWYALEYDDVLVMGISGCVSVILLYSTPVEFHIFQIENIDGF